jgi:hypothetical protein
MKLLANVLTTLLATDHAMAAFNDNAPKRNLKGRQDVSKPEHMSQKPKHREMQNSVPTGSNEVVIEVTYDEFPEETG